MRKVLCFLGGATLGAIIGMVLVLLFTPMSGEELRSQAQQRAQRTVDDVRTTVAEERKRLETELEALKQGEIRIT